MRGSWPRLATSAGEWPRSPRWSNADPAHEGRRLPEECQHQDEDLLAVLAQVHGLDHAIDRADMAPGRDRPVAAMRAGALPGFLQAVPVPLRQLGRAATPTGKSRDASTGPSLDLLPQDVSVRPRLRSELFSKRAYGTGIRLKASGAGEDRRGVHGRP